MLEGPAFNKTTLALVFSYSCTTTIFNECNWIWYPTRKIPTEISNRFGELNQPKLYSIEPNQTQLNPIELNQTQSNPIECSIGFVWPNFFVRVQLCLITKLNRTQSRDWVRLTSNNRTFDLVRLVLPGFSKFDK